MAADTGIYPTDTDGSVYTDAGDMPRIDELHYRFGSRVELSRTAQRGIFTARDDFRRRFSLQGKGVSLENRCLADSVRADWFCKLLINRK